MLYKLQPLSDPQLQKTYQQAIKDLNQFFKLGWKHHLPQVFLVPNRQTIDLLKDRKTDDWVIGWTSFAPPTVYLLDKENFETESCHSYSQDKYAALLKHELTHCFYYVLTDNYTQPRWLDEGIATYLSGQLKWKDQPEKLTKSLDFFNKPGKEIYSEAGWAVKILLDNFPQDTFLKLLEEIKKTKPNQEEFSHIFTRLYFEPSYKNFNQYLNQ